MTATGNWDNDKTTVTSDTIMEDTMIMTEKRMITEMKMEVLTVMSNSNGGD